MHDASTFKWIRVLAITLAGCMGLPLAGAGTAQAHQFSPTDYVLILVDGAASQSTPWNQSGTASMYVAPGERSSGNKALVFKQVVADVPVERRSSRKVLSPSDYGSLGQVPPGVYNLSYYRFDTKAYPPAIPNGFHRLGLGDKPCDVSSRKCDPTIAVETGSGRVIRDHLQFHLSWTNQETFKKSISEGCITLSTDNWVKLFPADFLAPDTSPMMAESNKAFQGFGRVLVFVTNVLDRKDQARQVNLFKTRLLTLGLTESAFESGKARQEVIRKWLTPE